MNLKLRGLRNRLIGLFETRLIYQRLNRLKAQVEAYEARNQPRGRPVIFFNASARIRHLSQNAAFSLLTSWGLRLSQIPVVYFVCQAGMAQCQLGAVGDPPPDRPPCHVCVKLSRQMYSENITCGYHFESAEVEQLSAEIDGLRLNELITVKHRNLPLGELCLPSLRWALRRHTLDDDPVTLGLLRKFLLSAAHVADTFEALLEQLQPRAVVVFNGISFPEAVAREVAMRRSVPVITHEVSAIPFSAFFSHGHATAYDIDIPGDFELQPTDEEKLDLYLSRRFQGDFTMAGIRFWPEIRGISAELLERIKPFKQVVAVFTNVIFDTSQIHANVCFDDMFGWLETVLELAQVNQDTLFIIRAHPDELRPGKRSLETVESKLLQIEALKWPNIFFVPPEDYLSSYDLIHRSKFVMVYNSSIGLEAALLKVPVLAGGQARYTHYPTVFLPASPQEYKEMAEQFLAAENIEVPPEFIHQARRFMYFHIFRASIDFSNFLRLRRDLPGSLVLRSFDVFDLHPDRCVEMEILKRGILAGASFVYPDITSDLKQSVLGN